MGGGNPVSGLTSVVRGTGRAIRENPEKGFLGPALLLNEGIEEEQKRQQKKLAGTQAQAQAQARKDAETLATANESVRAQKEKARKRTLFAGLQDQLGSQSTLG